jgi:hypothetical protein
MKMRRRSLCSAILILFSVCTFLYSGCTKSTGGAEREISRPPAPLINEPPAPSPDDAQQPYDLEEEMPEQDSVEPEELEETFEPIVSDSVIVEEATAVPRPKDLFGIGYRIQVFASRELDSAERMKNKVAAETELSVYIEFEDGYYKVRIGDFLTREGAAAERSRMSELYPDCWIVSTTIRK